MLLEGGNPKSDGLIIGGVTVIGGSTFTVFVLAVVVVPLVVVVVVVPRSESLDAVRVNDRRRVGKRGELSGVVQSLLHVLRCISTVVAIDLPVGVKAGVFCIIVLATELGDLCLYLRLIFGVIVIVGAFVALSLAITTE